MDNLLHQLELPTEIKDLCLQDMQRLAEEIRETLMEIKDKCGGHLASNLGVVELTIALHAVFNSPIDKFIWDVSHQCYVHKMLTGRLDKMFTIKKRGGLSGFAKIGESEHDHFGAGHASTALSAGLGMAHARDILGEDYNVISVVGDAALSGGMAYEAINNIDKMTGNFICILNDNDMSISPPVGSMAAYITDIRTSKPYTQAKEKFERIFDTIPKIGVPLRKRIEKLVERLRHTLIETKAGVLFEEFGFQYLGPLDGHNISMVMAALKYAKTYPGPIMIHLITTKGKGYEPAELDPVKYHGVSPKKPENSPAPLPTYTKIFGEEIIKIAEENDKVTVITPAMREGSGLVEYEKRFPERYFDVGIAEEHAVTFAAGLSESGVIPVLAIYSTFLQRGFDQVIHDVCLQNLPMVFALDRAGLVGQDGPTHHGVFDYAYLALIPNMTILAPKDGTELKQMLRWAIDSKKIVSIRYSKTAIPEEDGSISSPIIHAESECMLDSNPNGKLDAVLFAAGSMAWPAHKVAETLVQDGKKIAVINLRFIKPLHTKCILSYASRAKEVVVIEEGNKIGGVHSLILQCIAEESDMPANQVHSLSIPDEFASHGSVTELLEDYNLTESTMLDAVTQLLQNKPLIQGNIVDQSGPLQSPRITESIA